MGLLIEIAIGVPVIIVFLMALREAKIKLRQAEQGRDAMEKLHAMEKGDRKNGNGKVA